MTSTQALTLKQWNHISINWPGSSQAQFAQITINNRAGNSNEILKDVKGLFNRNSDELTFSPEYTIDEIRIYKRPLIANEIKVLSKFSKPSAENQSLHQFEQQVQGIIRATKKTNPIKPPTKAPDKKPPVKPPVVQHQDPYLKNLSKLSSAPLNQWPEITTQIKSSYKGGANALIDQLPSTLEKAITSLATKAKKHKLNHKGLRLEGLEKDTLILSKWRSFGLVHHRVPLASENAKVFLSSLISQTFLKEPNPGMEMAVVWIVLNAKDKARMLSAAKKITQDPLKSFFEDIKKASQP